jgi:ATP-dependent Clp protease ATP-binding subunit ClpC
MAPRAKKVFALAVAEAAGRGDHRIGTGEILLGIVAEGEGLAAKILVDLGADLPKVREAVLEVLSADGGRHTPDGPQNG